MEKITLNQKIINLLSEDYGGYHTEFYMNIDGSPLKKDYLCSYVMTIHRYDNDQICVSYCDIPIVRKKPLFWYQGEEHEHVFCTMNDLKNADMRNSIDDFIKNPVHNPFKSKRKRQVVPLS